MILIFPDKKRLMKSKRLKLKANKIKNESNNQENNEERFLSENSSPIKGRKKIGKSNMKKKNRFNFDNNFQYCKFY